MSAGQNWIESDNLSVQEGNEGQLDSRGGHNIPQVIVTSKSSGKS